MSPVLAAAAAVALGTAIGLARQSFARPFTGVAVVALTVAVLLRTRRTAALVCVLVALTAGATASAAWRTTGASAAVLPTLAGRGLMVEACGGVRLRRPRSVEIQANIVDSGRGRWRVNEPLRVGGAQVKHLGPGREICARGPLVRARPGRQEAPLLAAREVRLVGTTSIIRSAAADVRRAFSKAAQRALPRTQAGLLLGMTDGDVELLDERTMETFRTTGLAHLVAVSGSNVAVVLVIVVLISRALIPRGRWLRVIVAVPPLAFFAFLTGLEPSVLRAVFTAGVALAITAGGRTADALRVCAFAFVALMLTAPELLTHPGFQLSFLATLGLILWARPLAERLERVLPAGRLGRAAAVAAATTVAAQAAVAPLLAWHFERLPAIGGIANLVVAPLAPVVMVGGSLTLAGAAIMPTLEWLPATMRLPLDAILGCARWFAELPGASIGANVLIGIAVTGTLAAFVARERMPRAVATTVVVAAVAVAGGRSIASSAAECPGPAVHALDVGQGTAVLLASDDHTVLVDTGPADGGVVRELGSLGVGRLDAVVVSHPHVDHALGAIDVLEKLDVGRVFGPSILAWGGGSKVVAAAGRADVPVETIAAGDEFSAGPIHVEVLWPPPGPPPPFSEDAVDPHSLVLRAELTDTAVLLPGDIRAEQQSELVEEDEIAVPLLVAPHHGSKNLDAGFVDAVAPRVTLVTVGAPNPYGLPAPEAVAAYGRHGDVFRTDQDGRVSVCFRAQGAEVVTTK